MFNSEDPGIFPEQPKKDSSRDKEIHPLIMFATINLDIVQCHRILVDFATRVSNYLPWVHSSKLANGSDE